MRSSILLNISFSYITTCIVSSFTILSYRVDEAQGIRAQTVEPNRLHSSLGAYFQSAHVLFISTSDSLPDSSPLLSAMLINHLNFILALHSYPSLPTSVLVLASVLRDCLIPYVLFPLSLLSYPPPL
jgi:hypothetical protein